MTRRLVLALAMLVTGMLLITILPVGVRAAPVIEQTRHLPRFPVLTDPVNLSAKVTSPIPLQSVQVFYCFYYPPPAGGTCLFNDMIGPDSNQMYYWIVDLDPLSISMDYYFRALDTGSELTETAPVYIQYAFNITASLSADNPQPYPGQNFNLTIGAYYSDNTSAPTEYSSFTIVRLSSAEQWIGMTDVNGDATVEITAPGAVGTYTYEVTVTNRSLSDTAEDSIVVLVEPLPDIVAEDEDIVFTNSHPKEGETVTADITVENWGTLGATFYVNVTLHAGGTTRTLANVSVTIGPGNDTHISVSWDAVVGPQYINVTADPGNFIREASEVNNFASAFITGEKPPSDDESVILIILVVAVVFVIFIMPIIYFLLRRRRPRAPQE